MVVGGVIGYGFEYYNNYQQTKKLISDILPVRENNFNYKFIYPLLRYDFGDAKYYLEDKNLEQQINNYVQQQYQNKNAESISVQYTNLLNGEWSGINSDTQYYPGSLMKVLIMMDFYRQKQLDQSILEKNLYIQQRSKSTNFYNSLCDSHKFNNWSGLHHSIFNRRYD